MLVYLPTQLSDFVRANVGKYSSTMVRIWVWRVILFSNTEEQAILYSSREQGTWGISRVSKKPSWTNYRFNMWIEQANRAKIRHVLAKTPDMANILRFKSSILWCNFCGRINEGLPACQKHYPCWPILNPFQPCIPASIQLWIDWNSTDYLSVKCQMGTIGYHSAGF